jgi:hypothetical protein
LAEKRDQVSSRVHIPGGRGRKRSQGGGRYRYGGGVGGGGRKSGRGTEGAWESGGWLGWLGRGKGRGRGEETCSGVDGPGSKAGLGRAAGVPGTAPEGVPICQSTPYLRAKLRVK